jgi:hypothetical protein
MCTGNRTEGSNPSLSAKRKGTPGLENSRVVLHRRESNLHGPRVDPDARGAASRRVRTVYPLSLSEAQQAAVPNGSASEVPRERSREAASTTGIPPSPQLKIPKKRLPRHPTVDECVEGGMPEGPCSHRECRLPPRTPRLPGARARANPRLLARRGERGLAHHRRGGRPLGMSIERVRRARAACFAGHAARRPARQALHHRKDRPARHPRPLQRLLARAVAFRRAASRALRARSHRGARCPR